MSKLKPVRGTRDIWGEEARRAAHVVLTFQRVAGSFCFQEISTPVFEFTEVFARTLGESSDVVSKEMYTFEDRGGESITLRPEYTAGIARAYLSEGMKQFGTVKLYGHGPMFRYERPQKGRYRQFHQLDAEIIGAAEPGADIEIIALARRVLADLGLADRVKLHLNTLGDVADRAAYRAALVEYFGAHQGALSEDSKARLERNPLRILDSKDDGDRALLANAPKMSDYLSEESKAFFAAVRTGLETLGISYEIDERLVRGLDYYCHTSFEFITDDLGAQGTVIGGGRYDGLIEQMGGPPTPGVGWAGGVDRLAMMLDETPHAKRPAVVIPIGAAAETKALEIIDDLRSRGEVVDMAFRGNLKKRLQAANRKGYRAAIIIGEDELARGMVALRDLDSGSQDDVPFADLANALTADN